MNAKFLAPALVVVLGGLAHTAFAQTILPTTPRPPDIPTAVVPFGSGGSWGHASTLEEGVAHGIANVIAAAGLGNKDHSLAARNYAEAISRNLDNRLKAEQTYFEMRRLNREQRAAERGPRPTTEQMARYARDRAPDRLGPKELDPVTGLIAWPEVLEQEIYRDQRDRLDELFALRARYGGQIGAEQYLELQDTAKDLEVELKSRIRDYPPVDYVKAKNLVESLAYEASLSTAARVSDSRSVPAASALVKTR